MGGADAPLVAACALVLLLIVVVLFTARRASLSRRRGAFDCSVRSRPGHWSLGVARYGSDRIEWFRIFSFAPVPRWTWGRDELEVLECRPPRGGESTAVLPQSVVVTCRYRQDRLDLAMSQDAYTGMASWLEASPPGRRAPVT